MEPLVKVQLDIKQIIEKAIVNYKKSPKQRLTLAYAETRLETLEDHWRKFIETHRDLIENISDSKHFYLANDIYDKTEESYTSYKTDLKDLIANCTPSQSDKQIGKIKCNNNVKLPKITIPNFSGKYTEWTSFRNLFTSLIHNNEAIDDIQKLHYLRGHLSGEAEQLLRYSPVTAESYKESWSILNKRYDNKRFLSNSMLKRLMEQPHVTESSASIKELLDTTVDCLHGLRTIGIDISYWDTIVIYFISAKLDNESRKLWEATISSSDSLPTFDEFKQFLESRYKSLEFLDTGKSKQKFTYVKPKVLHTVTSEVTASQSSCPFCEQNHRLYHCKSFCKEDYDTRQNFVQTRGLCFNCLGSNHSIKYCRIKTTCNLCNRKHHSLLHPKMQPNTTSSGSTLGMTPTDKSIKSANPVTTLHSASHDPVQESEPSIIVSHFSKQTVPTRVLLATALVEAYGRNSYRQLLRALLDQGSQASFITESAVQLLGLNKIPSRSVITGIGGDESALASRSIVDVDIHSRHDPTFRITVRAYVLKTITSCVPANSTFIPDWPELRNITLADPGYHSPNKIDVLLGAEVYGQILHQGFIKHRLGSLIAQDTALGWILSGQTNTPVSNQAQCHNVVQSMHSQISDNDALKKFWEIESNICGDRTKAIFTPEEQSCEEFFAQTTKRDPTGRYIVRLPFRHEDPPCKYGNSRDIALKRFSFLENRFKRHPEIKSKYVEVIQEYLDLGHMEEVLPTDVSNCTGATYLPHHAVIREDRTTTKVRVVFDASCKGSNGASLNDSLMVGPRIQPELRHLIMKWRLHPIVLCADIVKMYRQVVVAQEDTDYQRIVWRSDTASEIKDYKLTRVTFGTASAPYLAVKSLQQLAIDEEANHPLVSKKVKAEFYVDDLMSGCQSVNEGVQIYKEMGRLLEKGGFQLQKWLTNSKDLEEIITGEENRNESTMEIKMDKIVKILGLSWSRETDSFRYLVKIPLLTECKTKRQIISEISRLFDPLGWAAPCVVIAKIMIQKLWLSGIDWDDEVPEHLMKEWSSYRQDLLQMHEFVIPRWLQTGTDNSVMELCGFADASNQAYAAVIYLRVKDSTGCIKTNLVTAKTKVAPIKQLSTPRLELMGAVLLAKLIREVAEVLSIPKDRIHCWSDSTVVLAWLSDHPCRWTTFVANRVSEILTFLDNTQWSHVKSSDNPADIASRGMIPSELAQCSLWKNGPSWLNNEVINYGKPKSIQTNLEMRPDKLIKSHAVTALDESLWTKYSSLQRLVRVVAYCRRFLKPKAERKSYLTKEEIEVALEVCIKNCQKEFGVELDTIKKKGKVSIKSKLRPLCPIIDKQGILRVRGRLENADIAECIKHPIILPQNHHLTALIIDEAHKKTLHGGPTLMLNYLRTKYWIISAKNLVKAHVRKCVVCIRHSTKFKTQLMGQLPTCRVTPARPFLNSGLDFAGPVNIRVSKGRGNKSYKGYICLFVCMATKAVHLEAISDMTSESFIAGFRRFVARRGYCSNIWSDNGTNFVGAAKEFKSLVAAEQSSVANDICSWLSNNSVTWHFIPPHAPNFGGIWERGIRSTKFHLRRIIGDSTLTYEEMATLLYQIEACLNSRPITQIKDSADDPLPLTPGHFLIGEPLVLAPDRCYEDSNCSTLKRWQFVQRMTQDFWRRWSQEYVTSLMHRYKWSQLQPEPEIGDVVLIKEDNLPPGKWLLGRVLIKHPGLDGLTRVVTIKSNNSVFKRPTSKLCILPVSND